MSGAVPADRPSVCGVVPAAGRGTRLGGDGPKILVSVDGDVTVWHLLHDTLAPLCDRLHVVVSPDGEPPFRAALRADTAFGGVGVSVQERPTGMGDAIFGAWATWSAYDVVLVVWGDQVNLSHTTVARTLAEHTRGCGPRVTLPLVSQPAPYVEYVFAPDHRLREVRQSREGDHCTPGGLSDVGCFALSTAGLHEAWEEFRSGAEAGAQTAEVNFLPFLPFLSARGWAVDTVTVADAAEARGVNTPDDLVFARRRRRGVGP